MARNSLYGSFLNQLPPWVLGGEYGQIAGVLNARENSFENVAQNKQQTLENDFKLQDRQQAQDLENALTDIWASEQRPATLKDMYGAIANAGAETGNPLTSMDAMAKLAQLDKEAQDKKLADLKNAMSAADVLGYERLNQLFPGALTPGEAAKIMQDSQRRERSAASATGRSYIMVDPTTGAPQLVPASEFNAKANQGWRQPKGASGSDLFMQMMGQMMGIDPSQADMGGAQQPGVAPAAQQQQIVQGLQQQYGNQPQPQIQAPPGTELRYKNGQPYFVKIQGK